ncbi:MAG: NADPH-dependent FMN reductase [Candidatus Micrarchaeales archaeon]
MDDKIKIKVILGSTRPGRFGDKPAHWILGELKKLDNVDPELLDLKEYPMPFFDQPISPAYGPGKYSDPVIQKWSDKIKEADAFIIVTPEYNHSYSAVLKNALDSVYHEWGKKSVGFVSYGSVGGARAIEQLRQVVIELQMVPIRHSIHIPWDIYMNAAKEPIPPNPAVFDALRVGRAGDKVQMFFDQLIWFAKALKNARKADE